MNSSSRGSIMVKMALNSGGKNEDNLQNKVHGQEPAICVQLKNNFPPTDETESNSPNSTEIDETLNKAFPQASTSSIKALPIKKLRSKNLPENNDIYACSSQGPIKMVLSKVKQNKNYYVSPIHSDESDIDDSDKDPIFTPISDDQYNSFSDSVNEHDTLIDAASNETVKGKKRVRQPEKWLSKKIKLLRNSGKPYVSSSRSKKQYPEKKLRPPCGEKCRLNCSGKINQSDRETIFNTFWKLADFQKQREYIVRHIEEIKPKYRYSSTLDLRKMNSAYYFQVNACRIRVCKSFFKSTLDINDRPIRTALSKKTNTGFLQDDLRGKHGNQPTIDPEVKESARNFIKAIPRIESHYLRAQTTREFIESGKSLSDIYRDYKDIQEKKQLRFVSLSMFNRIFRYEFNISFYVPKKDQCDLCESFKNSEENYKTSLLEAYNKHQTEKELSRKEKDDDKNNPCGAYVAVYDLQAVMPVPKGLVSAFYYKSKVNCFNFTISDLYAKKVECYFWNETEGNRGAVEIGSCVFDYIRMLSENGQRTDLDIIFYSDNCYGQQKNKYLLSLYFYAVQKFKLRSITHKFLIRGHSQNEGDNVHSVIEKQVKRYLKSSPIYVPQQYATLIRAAKKNGPSYRVHEMTYKNFYDLKTLQEAWGKNFNRNVDKESLKWQEIKVLRIEKDSPYSFFYKTSYEDKIYKRVNVRNTRKGFTKNELDCSYGLVQAYSKRIPLAPNKRKDIQEFFEKNIIPQNYYNSFFKDVLDLC